MKKRTLLLIASIVMLVIAVPLAIFLFLQINPMAEQSHLPGLGYVAYGTLIAAILYLLMGVAAYLVWTQPKRSPAAAALYFAQLAVNFIWPLLFFNAGAYGAALGCIAVLWALVLASLLLFFNAKRTAGLLMLPYLVWVTFAAVLNYGVWMLNR